jgi:hypothetical protein
MSKAADQKVYVAAGRLAGAAMEKVVSRVLVDDDNLLLGPSRAGIESHQTARAHHWGRAPASDLDDELRRTGGSPLCVVMPPAPGSLLSLCRVCSAALDQGRDVEVVQLDRSAAWTLPEGVDPVRSGHAGAEDIASHLASAVRWSRLETAFAASLWRLWCRRSPVAFSRFCATAAPLHPQIADLGRCHAGFFPRTAAGGLLPSRVDEVVLRQLSREWLTPIKIFVKAQKAGTPLGEWLSQLGDLFLLARLRAWAEHTQDRVVEQRRESPAGGSDMLAWSFRWGQGGEAILDALARFDVAPSLKIGGAVAYDPGRPWVVRLDPSGIPCVSASHSRGPGTS